MFREKLEVRAVKFIVELLNCTLGPPNPHPSDPLLRSEFRFHGDTHGIRNRIVRSDSTHVSLRSVGW